jgi:hypothetical protein
MNVGPAQLFSAAIDVREPARPVRPAQPPRPNAEAEPVKAAPKPEASPPVPSFAGDEVKVQRDTSTHVMIYQFVNQQSGSLVLQVPSKEVLDLTRGIQESLQKEEVAQQLAVQESSQNSLKKETAQPASTGEKATRSEGAKAHGN